MNYMTIESCRDHVGEVLMMWLKGSGGERGGT